MNNAEIRQVVNDFMKRECINHSILSRALGLSSRTLSQQLCRDDLSDKVVRRLSCLMPELREEAALRALVRLDNAIEWYDGVVEAKRRKARLSGVGAIIENPPAYNWRVVA